MFFYRLSWLLVWLPLRILTPLRTIGKKNLPKGKAILACNHQSNWDAVLIFSYRWDRPYVLAKHTLFKNKLVGKVMRSYGGIPVNREEVSISTIKEVIKALNSEKHLLIFPQGTRMNEMDGESVKNGLAMFALKTKSPIVPMWYVRKPGIFRFNKLLIGEPFELTEFYGQKPTKEVLDKASDVVIQKMFELRDNYEAERNKKKTKKLKVVVDK